MFITIAQSAYTKIFKVFCYVFSFSVPHLFSNTGITEILSDGTPKVKGPYSQAVQAGQFLFLSGQFGIDPLTNQLIGDTVEEQTEQALVNMECLLNARGLTFANVVKTEVYLKNLDDLQAMNAIYAIKFCCPVKPTRQTMQVVRLPLDALVQISCIAFIPLDN